MSSNEIQGMLVDNAYFVLPSETTLKNRRSRLETVFEWKVAKRSSTRCSRKT